MRRLAYAMWATAAGLSAAQPIPQVREGYAQELRLDESTNPTAFTTFTVDRNGLVYAGIAGQVVAIDATGNRTLVHALPPNSSVGFLHITPTELVFGDFGTSIWRLDLATGAVQSGSMPAFTYDVVVTPGGALLASAVPGLLSGGDAGIWLVDMAGGQHREVVTLSGPSGPITMGPGGELYYATQVWTFPTPAGSVDLLRFDGATLAAAIAGGPPLTSASASVAVRGLDGAFDLARDDRGRIYISDPQHGDVRRTLPGAAGVDPSAFVPRPTGPIVPGALHLSYIEAGAATFDPFQPDTGGTLYASFSDFASIAEVHQVRTARPGLVSAPSSPAPPGNVQFGLDGLPPLAAVALCFSDRPAVPESPLLVLSGTPVWNGLDWRTPPVVVPLLASSTGLASTVIRNPGGTALTLACQAYALRSVAGSGNEVGSTPVYTLTVLP